MKLDKELQKQKANYFLELHNAPEILILPNVWDAASTKIFELENFKALGTTSAGISSVLGYPDGQIMTFDESLVIIKRIVESTNLPVSVDIEAGYSESVEGVVETAKKVLEVGTVGINLEDSVGGNSNYHSSALYDVHFQCDKISAIREMAEKENIHLVINARTDVFLVSEDNTNNKIEQAVNRANRYKKAGADCIFVPDMGDLNKSDMTTLVNEIDAPINIIAGVNAPPIHELEKIGIARVSFGPRIMRVAFDLIRSIAKEIKNQGTYTQFTSGNISYSEVNSWFQ
ncbi:MAG: isocitrate lyase/phosphoenolpyruvate mutase family protein [Candidatus Latescibacterota bacterium]|jgi:2-methylisocitrate lyase-like PEP mutase family enzyme|nr:isocitrate lyase/phosphoenolpyruvate mutase family protein [Ignavibacteriaceae bacterium]